MKEPKAATSREFLTRGAARKNAQEGGSVEDPLTELLGETIEELKRHQKYKRTERGGPPLYMWK